MNWTISHQYGLWVAESSCGQSVWAKSRAELEKALATAK